MLVNGWAVVAALLIVLSLAGCSGPGEAGVDVPEEGTVVLHQPPITTTSGARTADTTIIFTTATEDLENEPDQGLQVTVGTRKSNAPVFRNLTQIARGTDKPTARVLDSATFARLWQNIQKAGLFNLPRYPGGRPPTKESYILVKMGKEQRIYTRPQPPTPSPKDDEETRRLLQYWVASRMAIVAFLNS